MTDNEYMIRTFPEFYSEDLELCAHITLKGIARKGEDEGCEYVETLIIYCEICKKEFKIEILVN